MPTNPQISKWIEQAGEVTNEANRMLSTLSENEVKRKESPSAWSIAEVFDHLLTTSEEYFPRIRESIELRESIESRKALSPGQPYRRGWFARWFLGMLEPANTKKLKAPSKFGPQSSDTGMEAIRRFVDSQAELQELLMRADGVPLGGKRFASPVTPLIRFTLGEGLDLIVTHQRRHLGQAQRAEERLV